MKRDNSWWFVGKSDCYLVNNIAKNVRAAIGNKGMFITITSPLGARAMETDSGQPSLLGVLTGLANEPTVQQPPLLLTSSGEIVASMQQPVTSSRTLPRLTLPASISPEPEEMRTSDVIDIDGEVEASREKRARERELQLVWGKPRCCTMTKRKCTTVQRKSVQSNSVVIHYVRHCTKKKAKVAEALAE